MPHASSLEIPAIAIIGMSGRFPGARDLHEFWQNLQNGRESITRFTIEELWAEGEPEADLSDSEFVPCKGLLEDAEGFDAYFFGYRPQEAVTIDPQQRLFLECAYASLEMAGYPPETHDHVVGVFGGVSMNTYVHRLYRAGRGKEPIDGYQVMLGNDKDHLATRVAYKLNLRGPSLTIQTACSTSLVAVERACRSLAGYECDLAVAGGASVAYPRKKGYVYQEKMILSPDGHCRVFDAHASGTVVGEGVGVVVLKRLEDAVADRDHVCAVIRGWATNNDGSSKIGYAAPSIAGQTEVISMAQELAGVNPASISYVEAHGTGTELGDAIELQALRQAFQRKTNLRGTCRLASVKSNIGHLDAAAGVAGLIKTVLSLQHEALPASLHFQEPNAKAELDESPFVINQHLTPWPKSDVPRRAGVSSFGIGGANAHLILEESPPRPETDPGEGPFVLPLSARTEAALEATAKNMAEHLRQHEAQSLADIAFTLQIARQHFHYRRLIFCRDKQEAIDALADCNHCFHLTMPENANELMPFPAEFNWEMSSESRKRKEDLKSIVRTWLQGGRPDWTLLHDSIPRKRVPIPTYPFERQIFDVQPQTSTRTETSDGAHANNDLSNMVYRRGWRRETSLAPRESDLSDKRRVVLVFADLSDLCTHVTQQLERHGDTVIRVAPGNAYKRHHELSFCLRPEIAADYVRLIRQLEQSHRPLHRVVHLWNLGETQNQTSTDARDHLLERGFQSLLFIAQSLERRESVDPIEMVVASSQVEEVLGDESLCPPKAAILGPCLVIPQEYPEIRCRHVDVLAADRYDTIETLATTLTLELRSQSDEPAVALRGRHRWVPDYSPFPIQEITETPRKLRERGVYLITGGLGNIGLALAAYLHEAVNARLVLTSRSPFPPPEQWENYICGDVETDPLAHRIRKLRELTIAGAEVLVLEADAADSSSWKNAMVKVHQRFGTLHGIIHSAGDGEATMIQQTTPLNSHAHFHSRVMGLSCMAQIAEENGVDFVLINSSLSSLLGGLGLSTYAASMNYLDSFVRSMNLKGNLNWISVNWDAWDFGDVEGTTDRRERALSPQEGVALFRQLMSDDRPGQIVFSTGDLSQRLQRWVRHRHSTPTAEQQQRHPRPPLKTEYVAPRTTLEQAISEVWQESLGLNQVGIHDDYLDLGGDSLLAGHIVVQLRRRLALPITVRSMFDNDTVAQLADHIERM